jgi:hypothetical protein
MMTLLAAKPNVVIDKRRIAAAALRASPAMKIS